MIGTTDLRNNSRKSLKRSIKSRQICWKSWKGLKTEFNEALIEIEVFPLLL